MVSQLLIVSVVILIYLSVYALLFIGLGLAVLFLRRRPAALIEVSRNDHGEVTVLIPAYNEGEGLLDAVVTVVKQDYAGFVEAQILLNDVSDNSLESLLKFYNLNKSVLSESSGKEQTGIILWRQDRRRVRLILTGRQTKKDKFNFILPGLAAPFVAFLDADHRPSRNWLSSSVAILEENTGGEERTNLAGVQTRRLPLHLGHLAQIWDSTQNHLGNELVNRLLSGRGKVFFTGTAAVFKTAVLKKFSLSDCITEDTYLSYDLWCASYAIAYNDVAASYEEVAPSFLAYVARRRRWSAGHNQVFFSHLKSIIRARLSLSAKLTLWLHGQFYLVPLAVWLLLSVYGLYFFGQLAANLRLVLMIVAPFLSLILAYAFRQSGRSLLRLGIDWLVALLWVWPQLAIISVYFYKLTGAENYYYILTFPYAKDWLVWHLILIGAPLVALSGAWYFFKDVRRWSSLWIIPTYILSLFLDIYAALLGFADFISGRAHWSKIERRNNYSASLVPPELKANLVTGRVVRAPSKFIYVLLVAGLVALLAVNDLLAVNNCGEVKPFLWPPLLFKPAVSLNLEIEIEKKIAPTENLRVRAQARISSLSASELSSLSADGSDKKSVELIMRSYLDGELIGEKKILPGLTEILDQEYPLGWEKHNLRVDLEGVGIGRFATCERQTAFSTTLKELRGNDLYINDEKFLVKGLIPSFANNQINLDMSEGLKQFKDIGINTIRFYHEVNDNLLALAAASQLLVIDQPDRSTWSELDLTSDWQVKNYLERYKKLVQDHAGEPYILWDGLGNEWELGNKLNSGRAVSLVNQIIKTAATINNPLTSYSTYYTFIKYPVDIVGINMLDTGQTYWEKALALIKSTNKPFYASEFGGFVAFWERTDPELRLNRLQNEWEALLAAGALGANFYESHDNWAQPVVNDYNDPWQAEQPDDLRGFWDEKNKPKPELATLAKILSDFSVADAELITDLSAPLNLSIKNIRPYNLQEVVLEAAVSAGEINDFKPLATQSLGNFKPGETKNIKLLLPTEAVRQARLALRFIYTSHSGLSGSSRLELILPVLGPNPLILNDDFISAGQSENIVFGRLISSDRLKVVLPSSWQRLVLNGQSYDKTQALQEFNLTNPYHDVDNLEMSRDGISWTKFGAALPAGGGVYYFRFRWPRLDAAKQFLILSGTGATQVEFFWRDQNKIWPTHNYRENVISAGDLGSPAAGELITIRINRDQSAYINQRVINNDWQGVDLALDGDMLIDLIAPRIFAPLNIELKKLEASDIITGPLRREGTALVDAVSDRPVFLKGVVYSPYWPGETGGADLPDDGRYETQLTLIRGLGANTISVFPQKMPAGFFQALDTNALWYAQIINIRLYDGTPDNDLLNNEYQAKVQAHLREVIDYTYEKGAPERLAFFAIGYEVTPEIIAATAAAHPTEKDWRGRFWSLTNRQPAEIGIARLLDAAMSYEQDKYGSRHLYTHIMYPGSLVPGNFFIDFADLTAVNLYPAYFYQADQTGPAVEPSGYQRYLSKLLTQTNKPLIISEAGLATARPIADDLLPDYKGNTSAAVAELGQRAWNDLKKANQNGGMTGFFWFEFMDEWWKNGTETADALTQNEQDSEEWFGIYSVVAGKGGFKLRPKEPIVAALQAMFAVTPAAETGIINNNDYQK